MDQKDEVKGKTDIVEVISSYLPLKKSGRNFAALCPFHAEKTPSLMISGERQVFKCFGCGESGDVFTFVQKVEGWDFREALEELAKKAGVTLKSFAPSGASKLKEKIIEINKLSMKFYKYLLDKHPAGAKAREYLARRKIGSALWEKYDLGFAPSGWENLENFLNKKGFDLADIATAGLVIGRDSTGRSFYDRFRNRLIFPLKDNRGTVLGFSGRVLDDLNREAKYINSPQTPIFTKGALLFGLDVAKDAIKKKNEVLLVEGEFDVLSANQVKIENVAAVKGTALTEKQVATIARIAESVALCFDKDIAGDTAARRGIEMLDIAGVNIRIVGLGKYKDPDEYIKGNVKAFKLAIENAGNIYDYLIDSACNRYDPNTPEGKKKIGQEILPILAKISDDLMKAHYIEKFAKLLSLDVSLIADAVGKKSKDISPPLEFTQSQNTDRLAKESLNLEEYFLALLLSQDEIPKTFLSGINPSDFTNDLSQKFWRWLRDIMRASKFKSLKKLLLKLPKNLSGFVDYLYLINISPNLSDKELWAVELTKITERLKKQALIRNLKAISQELKSAENKADRRLILSLTKKFNEVSKTIKKTES